MIKIAIMLEFAGSYGRGVLQGVMEYANLRNDWEFLMPPMYSLTSRRTDWRQADGIVAMVHAPATVESFRRSKVPIVNAARTMSMERLKQLRVPSALPDDSAVGRIAFDYFWERQFRAFGFCGHPTASWSLVRRNAFAQRCRVEKVFFSDTADPNQVSKEWILSLPRPCAILAANDRYAWHAIDVCRENGIAVPEEVAVVGVDNDLLLARMVRPELSSIDLGAERIGFEAARMLETIMRGKKLAKELVEIPPDGVITRHSTDVLNIDDPSVAEAVRFIREHASEPIGVEDVLAKVAMSRRNLERRFKKAMRRSLLDDIRRVRLERAARLLRETSLSIEHVAAQAGFNSHVRFTTVFHDHMNVTPTNYRKSHRPGAAY
jgi:LacI family transcriptional regulator